MERQAEDTAARMTDALGGNLPATPNTDRAKLVSAIGDVIEILRERSRLAHEAHRVIAELRRHESNDGSVLRPSHDPTFAGRRSTVSGSRDPRAGFTSEATARVATGRQRT